MFQHIGDEKVIGIFKAVYGLQEGPTPRIVTIHFPIGYAINFERSVCGAEPDEQEAKRKPTVFADGRGKRI